MIVPTNEQGVVVLFQELSKKLGYELISVQAPFPDAVVRDVKSDVNYRVEFEYRSSNFIAHKHNPNGCDFIVCWINDLDVYSVPIISLKEFLDDLDAERNRRFLRNLHVAGFISSFTWFVLGFSFLLIVEDEIMKYIVIGNMLIYLYVLLGMFFFDKAK